ncbi:mutS protein homolog 5-like isoform X2 [Rhipicephalus microplus]|uniref:mutS protein homolog 5-like isoform X2 n=1 Tax=Rhipicephalus microplus TaxID=6941 RepID=UPI003F6B2777
MLLKPFVVHSLANAMQSTTLSTVATADRQNEITTSDDDPSQVILSLAWSSRRFGAAYYDSSTCKMYLIPDQEDLPPVHSLLFSVLREVRPSCVLLSAKSDEKLMKAINDFLSPDKASSNTRSYNKEVVRTLPFKDFAYEPSRHRLLYLTLPNMPSGLSDEARYVYMASLIDFNAIAMVRSAGALLNYLSQCKLDCLQSSQDSNLIRDIVTCSLRDRIRISQMTLGCLQIFKEEWHPSVYKFGIAGKEGLSLFGQFNRCRSKVGSRELRKLFCRPTRDLSVLQSRQATVAFFNIPNNQPVVNSLRECLGNVRDVSTFVNVVSIIGICHSSISPECNIDILVKMTSLQIEDLLRITALIKKTLDFEESQATERFVVNRGIDSTLDEKKRVYNGLPDLLTRIAYGELEKLDPDITDCQVVYLPQIGYLLTIAEDAPGTDEPSLQFMFSCDNKSYFKTGTMKTLDSLLGDTLYEIIDRETEIMHKVQNMILEVAEAFLEAVSACGELDALLCLALVAREQNYVRPVLNSGTAIVINNGRHPLVESAGSSFVPNAFYSGGPHSKIKIITGPNNCGKSIYLKQVALIVYMAHIGSFVPAESAQIGAVDAILTCMYSEESLLHGLSSFGMQLNQMSHIFQEKSGKSLVIMDEFGKGTKVANGIGLVVGTIESFISNSATCPHTLLATHFHTVHDHLPATPHVTYLTFETLRHEGELVYLYQLKEGRASSSYASLVGQAAGLSTDIVGRQQQIMHAFSSKRKLQPQPMTRKEPVWNKALPLVQMLLEANLSTQEGAEELLRNMPAALK